MRRASSLARAKRLPDTLHPSLVSNNNNNNNNNNNSLVRRRGEVREMETSVRDLVRKSEKIKAEMGKFEELKKDVKQGSPPPPDTSDSGIVTDDSETKMGSRKKFYSRNHYEEPWKLSRDLKKRNLESPDRIEQELDKIETINSKIEKKEEQIVALSFEFNTLSEPGNSSPPPDAVIINSFISEVTRLRDANSGHLQEITKNRDTIKRINDEQQHRSKMMNQLEFDINMIEKEGSKLERSLDQLRLVELPLPLDLQYSSSTDCDNSNNSSESINLIPLPVRNINVTNMNPVRIKLENTELPEPNHLVSSSTLV